LTREQCAIELAGAMLDYLKVVAGVGKPDEASLKLNGWVEPAEMIKRYDHRLKEVIKLPATATA
jgi:hypothetical protein